MGFNRNRDFRRQGGQGGYRPGGHGGYRHGGQGGNRPFKQDEAAGFDRKRFMEKARRGVQTAMLRRDNILVHTVNCIDELNKSANLLSERLTEWYGVYFPELRVSDPAKYCKLVAFLDRENIDEARLRGLVGDAAPSIMQKARSSIGVKLPESDLGAIRKLSAEIETIYELRAELEKYQEKLAEELCPNLSHLAGAQVAAKIVAQAGSLQRLVEMPASTIQVLGAEKALFKHLKSGSSPPKHGVIFQHPAIGMAPKKLRGKIARALSTQMAIAVRADAISKNFIAPQLKEKFEKRVKAIMGKG
jgi:nucleolar protein 56